MDKAEELLEPLNPSLLENMTQDKVTIIAVPTPVETSQGMIIKVLPVAILKPLLGTVKETVKTIGKAFQKGYEMTK